MRSWPWDQAEGTTHTHTHTHTSCVKTCSAFGLWLDGELDKGSTSCCQAFNNAPLTSTGADFSCAAIEVYSLA